jgi:hypothetical protein
VVLAKRKELNVFHDYYLIVVFVKHGAVHDGAQVLFIALCEEEHGLRIALWGIKQALSVGVLAYADLPTWPTQVIKVDRWVLGVGALCAACSQWCPRRTTLVVPFHVDLAVYYLMSLTAVAAIHIRACG